MRSKLLTQLSCSTSAEKRRGAREAVTPALEKRRWRNPGDGGASNTMSRTFVAATVR